MAESAPAQGRLSPAELFGLLWDTMGDVLGTAATATLLRRALKRASPCCPELGGVAVDRDELVYGYRLPETWCHPAHCAATGALIELVRALKPLLVEMTGSVVLRRLARVDALRQVAADLEQESKERDI